MAATVKRNAQGEITHILVENEMMRKEDAHKVMFDSVDPVQVECFLAKKEINSRLDAIDFIADILNEKESIYEIKKKIFGFK